MAALVAIQRPELLNGVVFSAPAILPAAGSILVCTRLLSLAVMIIVMCFVAWSSSCYCLLCSTTGNTKSQSKHYIKNTRRGTYVCIYISTCYIYLCIQYFTTPVCVCVCVYYQQQLLHEPLILFNLLI